MWMKGKIYRVRLRNLEAKNGMVTEITFRKEAEAKAWVEKWKSQGYPFDADYITEEEKG